MPGEGTPSMLGDMDVPPFWPPFWHSGDWTRSFWGTFSHPPTPKLSFGVLELPILTQFDLGLKFHFSLDLFGTNFQRPAAHPHQFSEMVAMLSRERWVDRYDCYIRFSKHLPGVAPHALPCWVRSGLATRRAMASSRRQPETCGYHSPVQWCHLGNFRGSLTHRCLPDDLWRWYVSKKQYATCKILRNLEVTRFVFNVEILTLTAMKFGSALAKRRDDSTDVITLDQLTLLSGQWTFMAPRMHGPSPNIKTFFSGMGIFITEIRRSWCCLIFIMRVPMLVGRHLYIKTASSSPKLHSVVT